jgi:ankyrin repeat protein
MASVAQIRLLGLSQDGRADTITQMLAEADAPSVEFVDESGNSPLMYAAQKEGQTEVLAALLDGAMRKADINFQSPRDGSTAVMVAAFYGALDCVELLIQRGADLTLKNHAGKTVLELEETHEDSTSDARAVHAAIYSAQAALARPITPPHVHEAASTAAPPAEEDVHSNSEANQMLLAACRAGNLDDAKAAIDLDANPDAVDGTGRTALMHAAAGGHLDVVQFLIDEVSADRDTQLAGSNNNTALMHAVRHGQVECVEWMIAEGGCAIEGLQNGDGEQADTLKPVERVTAEQMAEAIARALARAGAASAAAEAFEDAAAEEEQVDSSRQPADEPSETAPQQQDEQNEEDEKYPTSARQEQQDEELQQDEQEEQQQPEEEEQEQEHPEQGFEAARSHVAASSSVPASPPAAASSSSSHSTFQPAAHAHRAIDARDARAFLDLPLASALQVLLARYKQVCEDVQQAPDPYIIAAVGNIALAGHALLLTGATASPARVSAKDRLDDATLHPLLETLGFSFPNAPISVLDASFNHLGRSSAQGLCVFLQHTHTLTHLNLEGNDIDRKGGEALAETLASTPGVLTRLNLNTNPIGPHAIAAFASLLQTNQTLTDLNLGNTDCETLSLMKLATALQTNRTLKRLNLDSPLLYSYQEETTIHLARCLGMNQGLVSLSLKGHRLSDAGAQWLAEYLIRNTTLTDISLARNGLTTTGVSYFVKPIAYRKVECLINFDGNILTGQRFTDINDQIADCKEARARNTVVWTSKLDRHSLRAKAPL